MTSEHFWLSIGLLGQASFSMRFLVQWIASERRKESVIPVSFWFFSIGGGLTLLIYAIYRMDPVFIIGQGAGLLVYLRNLYLIRRKQSGLTEARA
ncbi:MAG TPA: lipid-A-disaccharide synthase N-terminal domain-containing protein [Candidatus Dormibacteraeota bacterium]|nr:lipid-A-disaccharide synthase N-terminal domain-containing protein [Candidatus Dormibacteraeota bacterium]